MNPFHYYRYLLFVSQYCENIISLMFIWYMVYARGIENILKIITYWLCPAACCSCSHTCSVRQIWQIFLKFLLKAHQLLTVEIQIDSFARAAIKAYSEWHPFNLTIYLLHVSCFRFILLACPSFDYDVF